MYNVKYYMYMSKYHMLKTYMKHKQRNFITPHYF